MSLNEAHNPYGSGIYSLNDLKQVLLRRASWGYEIVITRRGDVRVFLHRNEFDYLKSYVSKLLDPNIRALTEFKKQSRIWDIKMWWRSL